MALHQFAEIDGNRVQIDPDRMTLEYSCDHCGQFIDPDAIITLTLTLETADGVTAAAANEVHAYCAAARAAELAERQESVLGS